MNKLPNFFWRGSFNGHANLIPNNKIVSNVIPQEAADKAEQIAQEMNGDVAPAYSLIKYDREIQPNMESAFGGAVIHSLFISNIYSQ